MSDETVKDIVNIELVYNELNNVVDIKDSKNIKQFDENGKVSNEFMLLCLLKAGGNISKAAQISGTTRWLYYDRAKRIDGFDRMMQDIRETKIDIAEDKLWEHIEMGNPHAIMFYLKTIGKGRGYTTSTDVNINSNNEIKIDVNFVDMKNKLKELIDESDSLEENDEDIIYNYN